MPSDDNPINALEQQFRMEDLSVSPVTKTLVKLLSAMPSVWPFDKGIERVKEHLASDSAERIRLMLETCIGEILKHESEIDHLKEMDISQSQPREEVLRELLLDAARKAESIRARERVKRIGLILANAAVEENATDADEIEEMMRVAMELSDRDIELLKELIKIEGSVLANSNYVSRYDAYTRWSQGFWGERILPEIDSVFSKLESYGLVARIPPPNNLNIMADFQNRYVLLKKGLRFSVLISEAAGIS